MQYLTLLIPFSLVWLFVLHVLKKAGLRFWHFIWGSLGLFILMMVFVRPWATEPLAQCVTAISGIVGSLTNTFEAFFKYGIIFVESMGHSITLQIDMECSGIIEIMAFICLLSFFDVYSRHEKFIVGTISVLLIVLFNSMRIVLICLTVYFFGVDSYGIVHTFIARLFFYALTVALYFFVFTKPHIIRMKVGEFRYARDQQPS